jgi:hypothetical protein
MSDETLEADIEGRPQLEQMPVRTHGWGDEGVYWNALSQTLRKSVDTCNRVPANAKPEARLEALKRLREQIKHDPEGLEQFVRKEA